MITISTDLNATTAPLLQSARPLAASTLPAVALTQAPPPPAVEAPADPLTALLQTAADPPDQTLPPTDLARRYAESGTLTAPRPDAAAAAATPKSPDDKLLQTLREAYRNSGQTSAQPGPAQQAPAPQAATALPAVVIDGRTIPLTPAQAAAIRAAIGATPRRIGRGAESGEIEAPRGPSDAVEDDKTRLLIRSVTEASSADMRRAGEFAPSHDEASRTSTAAHRNADIEKARALASDDAWIPPPLPLPDTANPTTLLAPVPHPVAYIPPPQTALAIADITIAFASGIDARDVVVLRNSSGGITIVATGTTEKIELPAALPITLSFADGSTRRFDPA